MCAIPAAPPPLQFGYAAESLHRDEHAEYSRKARFTCNQIRLIVRAMLNVYNYNISITHHKIPSCHDPPFTTVAPIIASHFPDA